MISADNEASELGTLALVTAMEYALVVTPSSAVTVMTISLMPAVRAIADEFSPELTTLPPTSIVALPLVAVGLTVIVSALKATSVL